MEQPFGAAMAFLCCGVGPYAKTFELTAQGLALHRTMDSLNADVTCVRYNHNGRILASCSTDGGISLDVAVSGELLSRFFYPATSIAERRVNGVHFSSGSRFLASAGADGCVRVWDLKTQEVTQTYHVSASPVSCVTFSGVKDEYLVAGSDSGGISICDLQTSEPSTTLGIDYQDGVSNVTALQSSLHPQTRGTLGATYADGSVRIWDLPTAQLSLEFPRQHDAAATCLVLSPVSKALLASGGLDRRVVFYDMLQRTELRSIDFDSPISSLALCSDGKTMAVGTTQGNILIYDLRGDISPLYSTVAHDRAAIQSLQFAPPAVQEVNSVFPQHESAVATATSNDRMSPRKGETPQDTALRKLQSLEQSDTLQQTYRPAYRASSPSRQQRAAVSPSRSTSILQNGAFESELNAAAARSREQQSNGPRSSVRWPSSNSEDASSMRLQLQILRQEMETQHRAKQDQFTAILDRLLFSYEALVNENSALRQENEALEAHFARTNR